MHAVITSRGHRDHSMLIGRHLSSAQSTTLKIIFHDRPAQVIQYNRSFSICITVIRTVTRAPMGHKQDDFTYHNNIQVWWYWAKYTCTCTCHRHRNRALEELTVSPKSFVNTRCTVVKNNYFCFTPSMLIVYLSWVVWLMST